MGHDYMKRVWLRRLATPGPRGWLLLYPWESEFVLGPGRCIPDNDNVPLCVQSKRRRQTT